jgi:hypothetical protein
MKPVSLTWDVIIDAFAVLIGDYDANRKKCAHILLKYFAPKDVYAFIMHEVEKEAPVIDRCDPRVAKWRKKVVKRGCCERCGTTERLEAHHIAYWSESPKDRINLKNGECLCHDCHTNEHRGERVYYLMLSKK